MPICIRSISMTAADLSIAGAYGGRVWRFLRTLRLRCDMATSTPASHESSALPLSERGLLYASFGLALVPLLPREKKPHHLDLLADLYGDTGIDHLRAAAAPLPVEIPWWFQNDEDINRRSAPISRKYLLLTKIYTLEKEKDIFTKISKSNGESCGKSLQILARLNICATLAIADDSRSRLSSGDKCSGGRWLIGGNESL